MTTRSETGRALGYALVFTCLAMLLTAAALLGTADDERSTAVTILLAATIAVLAVAEGVLIGALRAEAERIKREVEQG